MTVGTKLNVLDPRAGVDASIYGLPTRRLWAREGGLCWIYLTMMTLNKSLVPQAAFLHRKSMQTTKQVFSERNG